MPNIPNTIIEPRYLKDKLLGYNITTDEGYCLHTTGHDIPIRDEKNKPTGEVKLGFTTGTISLGRTYDFDTVVEDTYTYTDENENLVSIPIKKIGKFELFTLPVNIIPKKED